MADGRDTAAGLVRAFNGHDGEALRTMCAPNGRLEAPGGVRLLGRTALAGQAEVLFNGFPDARLTVQNELVSGPRVMQEFTFEGTHTGPLVCANGTIAATGRKVIVRGVIVGRYERGVATDVRLYHDQLDALVQLGLAPPRATSRS
jgi:hypothetical protein